MVRQPSSVRSAVDESGIILLFVQVSPTLKYLCLQIRAMVGQMVQIDETDLVYEGPWIGSAQQRLFQTLEPTMLSQGQLVDLW
jgi:hypothetical protein